MRIHIYLAFTVGYAHASVVFLKQPDVLTLVLLAVVTGYLLSVLSRKVG